MSSQVWMGKGKKRKAEKELAHEESDDDGLPNISPFLFPKLLGSTTVYAHLNHVYFNDDITSESSFALCRELRTQETRALVQATAQNIPPQPLYLHLTTNGGCVHSAFSVVDCIQSLKVPVYTVVDGFVASAGTLISLAGTKRYIMKNAYMLIHEVRSGLWGKMTAIEDEYTNLKKLMDHIVQFYAQRTNITKKCLEKILTKDIVWNADECINKGLIDGLYP